MIPGHIQIQERGQVKHKYVWSVDSDIQILGYAIVSYKHKSVHRLHTRKDWGNFTQKYKHVDMCHTNLRLWTDDIRVQYWGHSHRTGDMQI